MEAVAKWDAECRRVNSERQRDCVTVVESVAPLFESIEICPECNENYVQSTTLQTRSADESMTEFYWCSICNHRWKI